jgi:hypothetical protein
MVPRHCSVDFFYFNSCYQQHRHHCLLLYVDVNVYQRRYRCDYLPYNGFWLCTFGRDKTRQTILEIHVNLQLECPFIEVHRQYKDRVLMVGRNYSASN